MKTLINSLCLLISFSLFAQEASPQPPPKEGERGASPIPSPIGGGQEGATYAVVVGISDYQDEGIPDLRFADKDAEAFANFLRSPAGGSLDEDHLKVLVNDQATAAQVASAMYWLMEVAEEGGQAIIYFSGHGDVEAKFRSQPGFLLCWDAPAKVYMAGGVVDLRMLQDVISAISLDNKAKVVVVTDACRAGKLAGSEIGGAQTTTANLQKQFANEIKILSCQPNEFSIEGEQWGGGRGAFSYHLVDGLYGMADGNGDLSVNLMEIGRYLQDKVTTEVAPQSQIPMTVGNFGDKLVTVYPELLSQVQEGKKGQMPIFSSTESRGIEENVLAAADSNIVVLYDAFKEALEDQVFLEPATASADYYFEQLIDEPQLQLLHSSMTRNYAAALQDDVQQVINLWLKSDIEEYGRHNNSRREKFRLYPQYLERAANLLGQEHYMYNILIARKLFFEGYLISLNHLDGDEIKGQQIINKYRESLKYEADQPYVLSMMSYVFSFDLMQYDSADYYQNLASALAPTWIYPYLQQLYLYSHHSNYFEKAKLYLDKAMLVDSNSAIVRSKAASYYARTLQFSRAEAEFLKAIEIDSTILSAISGIGFVYTQTGQYDKAESFFIKASQKDSTNWNPYLNLCYLYFKTLQFEKIEEPCLKCIELSPGFSYQHWYLGGGYIKLNRIQDAESQFREALKYDSVFLPARAGLAAVFFHQKNLQLAKNTVDEIVEKLNLDNDINKKIGLGYYLGAYGFIEASERILQEIIAEQPAFGLPYYEMACIKSLNEKTDETLDYLDKALTNGYNEYDWIMIDPDLKFIRSDKRFDQIMQKHFPGHHKD